MTKGIFGTLDPTDEKSKATLRRLLLAKQVFLHGIGHSEQAGPLNKMIAIHNLHNAIEIVLRAIFLHFEIRAEKELNISFENMLTDIEQHEEFKSRGIKLPYRVEMRNLNQARNLVQHHATEPAQSTLEEAKVFTSRFLIRAYDTFFSCDFDSLTPIDMIQNEKLRELLNLSLSAIEEDIQKSLTLAENAFYWASRTILDFLPTSSSGRLDDFPELRDFSEQLIDFLAELRTDDNRLDISRFTMKSRNNFRALKEFSQNLSGRLNSSERNSIYYSALLSSGINLVDYRRYKDITAVTTFGSHTSMPDNITKRSIQVYWQGKQPTTEEAVWVHNFVVNSIVHWQMLGLKPSIPNDHATLEFLEMLLKWSDDISFH